MKFINYLFLTLATVLGACSQKDSTDAKVADTVATDVVSISQKQFQAAKIALGSVEKRKISSQIRANGIIDVPPQSLVVISPPMGGFIRYTSLKEGMKVKKGDVLVTLENIEFIQLQQDYLESKSKLEYLEAEYVRQEQLAKENINSAKTMQLAKSNFDAMKASVKALEAKLSLININPASLANGEIKSTINLYSPIDGYVSSVKVNLGQYVNSTDAMFNIVNLDHVHVLLYVYEKDIPLIREGQEVKFKIGNEGYDRLATIYLLGKEITPERTIHVHCHLKEEKQNLLQGMFVSATIEVEAKNADVLPGDAILTYEDKHVVFLTTNNPMEFKMVDVNPGQTSEDYTEVSFAEQLPANVKVVTTGANHLLGVLKNRGDED